MNQSKRSPPADSGEHTLWNIRISFGINEGQKVGFIAKNGTGKTSLLDILAGFDAPDAGKVVYRKDITTAFLPQEPLPALPRPHPERPYNDTMVPI